MIVSCKLLGGLGNNLFIIATTIAYALKHGIDYCIPLEIESPHEPGQKVFHSEKLNYCYKYTLSEAMEGNVKVSFPPFLQEVYTEPFFHYQKIPKFNVDKLHLSGYFQSYKYFNDYRPEILTLLNIPKVVTYNKIFLHYRLGDYKTLGKFHKIISPVYIIGALNRFKNRGFTKLIVFSDEIELARQELQGRFGIENFEVEYSTGRTDLQELAYMASCAGGIMSPSSFSYWGAWLGNKGRTIVYPRQWFGESLNHDTRDLCPPSWQAL